MTEKRIAVFGTYPNVSSVEKAVDTLKEEGFTQIFSQTLTPGIFQGARVLYLSSHGELLG